MGRSRRAVFLTRVIKGYYRTVLWSLLAQGKKRHESRSMSWPHLNFWLNVNRSLFMIARFAESNQY